MSAAILIDLCSPPNKKEKLFASTNGKAKLEHEQSKKGYMRNSLKTTVSNAATVFKTASLPATNLYITNNNDDNDIAIIGGGRNVLTEFPHSREDCVLVPFATTQDPSLVCPNCYCYVCDIPSQECPVWYSHCRAKHDDSRWKTERQAVAQAGGPVPFYLVHPKPPQPGPWRILKRLRPVNISTSPSEPSRHGRCRNRPDPETYSIDAILKQMVTVYPYEVTPPPVFTTQLKHYQKQSLAFMCDVESSNDPTTLGMVSVQTSMNHRNVPASTYHTRGGWLATEVGMGKTAIVLALVASDQERPLPRLVENERLESLQDMTRLKATVVVTSISLLGQWEDECRKHAPGLKCLRYHSTSRSPYGMNLPQLDVDGPLTGLQDANIIITTATTNAAKHFYNHCFNRIVIDESHLLGASTSMTQTHLAGLNAERRWCVTATPFVSCPDDIYKQGLFLGFNRSFLIHTLVSAVGSKQSSNRNKDAFYAGVDLLKKIMIRHTKDQEIGGAPALALPESTTLRRLLDMTCAEKQLYDAGKLKITWVRNKGARPFTLDARIASHLVLKGENAPTKINALLQDINRVRIKDPNLKAVVFTQYKDTHQACVKALQLAGILTHEFSGSTNASARDKVIRLFQENTAFQVFVVTLKSGAVGVTLTAASRVYLMEPCINPALMLQAAGRVHRLGQTKKVKVIKFAFKNSFEANILRFHRKMADGSATMSADFVPPGSIEILMKGL